MAPRTDRKLAAILAADVVGYSRLVGDDEAGTIARLKELRKVFIEPLVAEYRGRVVKLMGDGALVEFPSAVDAIECAVAIQQGVAEREAAVPEDRQIALRIGINIGDIIIEDGDILGDGVNVAARLEALAEPGGICVARNVYNQVKAKLEVAFEPMGEHRVKNIAEPVTVYRVNLDAPGRALNRRPVWAQRRWQAAAATVLVLALGAGGTWYGMWRPAPGPQATTAEGAAVVAAAEARPALPLPDKPSIAVLPFDNLSGDPKQERLAGGLTEDVITDLARFRELFVIARNSTEVYRGKAVDVRQVAHELGVQYVLEGSLQIDGDRVRITAQLADGTTGNHVWAERYDRPLDDVFAVQDEVTQKIAGTLAPSMSGVLTRAGRERAHRKPPESLQAYENYLLGIEHKHRFTQEDTQKAQELLKKAIDIDPTFARAYVGLAMAHVVAFENGWTTSPQDSLDNILTALRQALALDPSDGQAHVTLGIYYIYVGDMEQSLAEHEKALSLNPNDADVLLMTAGNMTWFGRPEQAAELADQAVRLNPNYPDWYGWGLLLAYFYDGQYERALSVTQGRLNPDIWDYIYRPLIYAQLGRKADVATSFSDLLQRNPEYVAERWLSDTGTFRDVELNLFLDSHRKAGLPLCATEEQLAKYPDMKRLELCEAQRASG
jgi:TolB-like protein/class 3 adenylate cyclase